jgi:hypothetical protein
MIYFPHIKNVRMVGKNLLARLHAIVFIGFQEKLTPELLLAVRLVDSFDFILSVCFYVTFV